MNTEDIKKELVNRLEDYTDEDLLAMCQAINSQNGAFEFCDVWDLQELALEMDAYTLAKMLIWGNVTSIGLPVRYDGYGNLESVDMWDLEAEARDCIDEIADYVIEYYDDIKLYLYQEAYDFLEELDEQGLL